MTHNQEFLWFQLLNANGFGSKSIFYLYENAKANNLSIKDIYNLGEREFYSYFPKIGNGKFSKSRYSSLHNYNYDKLFTYYQKLKEENINIINLEDEHYPNEIIEKLKDESPPVLFCKGYLQLIKAKSLAIVGSRNVEEQMLEVTKNTAKELSKEGYNIISGYAKGVDTAAHKGALEIDGTTTAVLSYGFNHLNIKKELKLSGWERNSLFISQFLPFEKFSGKNAMGRNRIVCALSKAVIVIFSGPEVDENGKMSGTFEAGKSALNMNIPLFVLSPSYFPEGSAIGNQELIKKGGTEFNDTKELLNLISSKIKNTELKSSDVKITSLEQRISRISRSKSNSKKKTKKIEPEFDFK